MCVTLSKESFWASVRCEDWLSGETFQKKGAVKDDIVADRERKESGDEKV